MRRTISAPEPNAAPPIDWDIYEAFARDSLFAVCEGDHPDAVLLRQQLRDVEFAELDYTGAGFFLTLRLASDGPTLSGSGVVGDVHVNVPGCEGPLGLLLFVKGGRAEMLEAFAYADWPDDLRGYYFQYVRWEQLEDGRGARAANVDRRDPDSMWSTVAT